MGALDVVCRPGSATSCDGSKSRYATTLFVALFMENDSFWQQKRLFHDRMIQGIKRCLPSYHVLSVCD